METSLAIVVVLVLVFLGIGSYFFLMIFFPEWVGITGPVAKKNLDEHREGTEANDSTTIDDSQKPSP